MHADAGAADRLRHMPALDGLRALAVALVVLYHARVRVGGGALARAYLHVSQAGWIGVDLFFVLSGFLITGILLDARDDARFFRNFYVRRTLRIFPLYYAVLFATFVVAKTVLPTDTPGMRTIVREQAWLWTYATNLDVARHGEKIFTSGWISLTHTWSLAIEEQFYLVWPLLVRLLGRRGLVATAIAIVLAAPVVRTSLLAAGTSPAVVYQLTPCRLDTLAIGALAAVLVRARPSWVPRAARWALGVGAFGTGAVLLVAHGLDPEARAVQTVGFSMLAVACGGLVLRASRGVRVLEARALATIGTYSYGLYIFHALLMPLFRRVPLPASLAGALAFTAMVFAASLAIAAASWHLFERRFLALKERWAPRPSTAGYLSPSSSRARAGSASLRSIDAA